MTASPPVVWSIAGTDSAGGAGLAADQRAADAFGVHLCPVVAAVTAQHSRAVTHIEPLRPELIDAQLRALEEDLPPAAVKTGLLGGPEQVRLVARWIDRLRSRAPVALVVDPVLGASTGVRFADEATLAAYRDELLPRATVATPNSAEAARLLGAAGEGLSSPGHGLPETGRSLPEMGRALRALGTRAACITGGDAADAGGLVLDWLDAPHASGWLAAPRVETPHTHGTGCTHATSVAAALALGFVEADAAVLAKMATRDALLSGHGAGRGAGPVAARRGFAIATESSRHDDDAYAREPAVVAARRAMAAGGLPLLSFGEDAHFVRHPDVRPQRRIDLYAIVDSAERVPQVLAAGVRSVQLRIKSQATPKLHEEARAAWAACRAAGAEFFLNDHAGIAAELGCGVHLGQEDLAALGPQRRAGLLRSRLPLGVSSHSLWELARAAGVAPRYLACGPVWPTLTKAMPWIAQGLDNLAWWCRVSPAPVVAIGGVLEPAQLRDAARCGADGVCLVRALGDDPSRSVPAYAQALADGRAAPPLAVPALPHPSLSR